MYVTCSAAIFAMKVVLSLIIQAARAWHIVDGYWVISHSHPSHVAYRVEGKLAWPLCKVSDFFALSAVHVTGYCLKVVLGVGVGVVAAGGAVSVLQLRLVRGMLLGE